MGDEIYTHFSNVDNFSCRVYAPVGGYNDLLPYLVRRLLENGANTSFIHQLNKKNTDEKTLLQSPLKRLQNIHKNKIVKPENIFPDRKNSIGVDLTEEKNLELFGNLESIINVKPSSIVNGVDKISSITENIVSPYSKKKILGQVNYADTSIIYEALENLNSYNNVWKNSPLSKRIDIVNKFSILLESNYHLLVSCCVKEAGYK